jgi:hypothetical protein
MVKMQRKRPLETHISKAAYYAWHQRVLGGASPVSTPEQERADWFAGKREIEHMLGMVDLCRQLLNCNDVARKIRLAVTFFVAEDRGTGSDDVTEQTRLPKSKERLEYICAMAGNAAINMPLRPPQKPNTVGQLIRLMQGRAREISRSRTVSARKKQ